MDNTEIQCLILINGTVLVSGISAVMSELGEPDCKLVEPYEIIEGKLSPWLSHLTDNTNSIMISSDKILTLVDPKELLLNDYLELIK
jgi:hypothetical protein